MTNCYIYLHGFASSPRSTKAQAFVDRFRAIDLPLLIPDLNQPSFTDLTLTRQIQQTQILFPPSQPVTLIGSSFGGLTAAWLAQQQMQVDRIVLLAPAFGFLRHWLPRLGSQTVQEWRSIGTLSVYHYGEQQQIPLSYKFVEDASQYDESQLQRSIPTLILHGRNDDVIPVQASRDFAIDRSWVKLIELDSDHALTDVMPQIWQEVSAFCSL
ncbi:alpha/beta fold hydrolase [Microcoleus sp. FACHB-1515]|uniref:YqiA/YcfP family alpha/beta fold hydrolase n=1 Tax=Cyanophyceae TaxID=3028117 RepID=UPI001688EBC1|nr:YqiA/YcfP family alpha/beta fold hydrolase [Microcoleus sp. FACHB-1515]MBD2088763.1 alpha/beta fold hydrolase [Microcoleus sp. FACHB-1515]